GGDPRPAGTQARDRGGSPRYAPGLGDRRSRCGDGRQLRAHSARRGRRRRRRGDRRHDQPARDDGDPREPAPLSEHGGAHRLARERRQARARLGRRDPRGRVRDAEGDFHLSHNTLLVFEVTILVIAIFLGFEVISKVPTLLHTPLMSGTNAIHGIVLVGAMIVLAQPDKGAFTWIVGFVAVVLASANVVGGFVVTDRMLEMFKKREPPKSEDGK